MSAHVKEAHEVVEALGRIVGSELRPNIGFAIVLMVPNPDPDGPPTYVCHSTNCERESFLSVMEVYLAGCRARTALVPAADAPPEVQ